MPEGSWGRPDKMVQTIHAAEPAPEGGAAQSVVQDHGRELMSDQGFCRVLKAERGKTIVATSGNAPPLRWGRVTPPSSHAPWTLWRSSRRRAAVAE